MIVDLTNVKIMILSAQELNEELRLHADRIVEKYHLNHVLGNSP
jgi:hypothetical protein